MEIIGRRESYDKRDGIRLTASTQREGPERKQRQRRRLPKQLAPAASFTTYKDPATPLPEFEPSGGVQPGAYSKQFGVSSFSTASTKASMSAASRPPLKSTSAQPQVRTTRLPPAVQFVNC